MGISCDICKYGEMHDYVRGNFYCNHPKRFHGPVDFAMETKCSIGEVDEWSYNHKYKPLKKNVNVTKDLVDSGLKDILSDIASKDKETIAAEISSLAEAIANYREPGKCETCKQEFCEHYAHGARNCQHWE